MWKYTSGAPQCDEYITVKWDNQTQQAIVFHDDAGSGTILDWVLSNGTTLNDYYFGNYICTYCDPSALSESYTTDDSFCSNYEGSQVQFFEFVPNEPDNPNPCLGGGLLKANKFVNGNAQTVYIPVGAGLSTGAISTDWIGSIEAAQLCQDGGGCLFNSGDLFPGLILDKPILGQYCLHDPIELPDQDGDGWPDITDPCPTQINNECFSGGGDPFTNPPPGGWTNPQNGCYEEWDISNCQWIQSCPGQSAVVIPGTNITQAFSGFDALSNCYYCFEAEICEVEFTKRYRVARIN